MSIPRNNPISEHSRYTYAIVSTEMRRDLDAPLEHFQQLKPYHLYHVTPWNDMVSSDFSDRTAHYGNAQDLYARLQAIDPDIVQGVEPFALKPFPRVKAVSDYVLHHQKVLVLVSCENLPFARKYGPLAWMLEPFIRKYIQLARFIIYLNEGARQNFLRYGAPPERMLQLMYGTWGVDLEEYSPEGDRAELAGDVQRVILFVGRIHKMKGVFDLLAAFRQIADRVPDVTLVFIGSGPAEAALQQQCQRNGLGERVRFLGTVKNRYIASYMRRASIFVSPARTTWLWAEQIGMTMIQALGCGVPVVSTTSGSIGEFIKHNETGLLVPEHDPTALAQTMYRLLTDPALHARLSAGARTYACTHYDARRNVQRAEREIIQRCAPTPQPEGL